MELGGKIIKKLKRKLFAIIINGNAETCNLKDSGATGPFLNQQLHQLWKYIIIHIRHAKNGRIISGSF
jgi:hypothetical protein